MESSTVDAPERVAPDEIETPLSISGLAEACGVSRQRIYVLVKAGMITATPMAGAYVIMPDEAKRVIRAATRVRIKGGQRQIRFALDRI